MRGSDSFCEWVTQQQFENGLLVNLSVQFSLKLSVCFLICIRIKEGNELRVLILHCQYSQQSLCLCDQFVQCRYVRGRIQV